ncbi:hypothetical protein GCM10025868_21080 [Angustibacter aerolatus]|uniref:Nitrate/nitrite sensing protein domain-containing protein n=1 Tax=Angustibacter aerolatus TaxID=1162965 RepID=A0ABQ6JF91_9ACTN|nr:nitrate- and nitrite sensing domain-containing protein [Angustibacter aerolatus]GMA86858.1 hypothetical protein GCM10025868_21080 [Angustibacter aerolatus]
MAYSASQRLTEVALLQREAGLALIRADGQDSGDAQRRAMVEYGQQDIAASTLFRQNATAPQQQALDNAVYNPPTLRGLYREAEAALERGGSLGDIDTAYWRAAANPRIDALNDLGAPIAAAIAATANDTAAAARARALFVLLGSILLVVVVGGLGVYLARAMTRPLRRLTAAAGEPGRRACPAWWSAWPPRARARAWSPEIQITSNDEVGHWPSPS